MPRRRRSPWLYVLLLPIVFLAGCGSERVVAKPDLIRLSPPPALLQCLPAPDPAGVIDDKTLAGYILDLAEAGADCRDKVRAIGEWAAPSRQPQ